jgi:hypothetical protein
MAYKSISRGGSYVRPQFLFWRMVFLSAFFMLSASLGSVAQHSADTQVDWRIDVSELTRVIQLFNAEAYHCEVHTEDGYDPGSGSANCHAHDSDYDLEDWHIRLNELLRLVQLHNAGDYHAVAGTEDDFAPGVAPSSNIVINELLASNRTGLLDEDGNPSDWIELYNSGITPISLAGWTITDNNNIPDKWTFPDVVIDGGAYLVIFASQLDRAGPEGALHTNFKLGMEGEYLALVDATGELVETTVYDTYPRQRTDYSYGLDPVTDDLWYFDTPTPGRRNIRGNRYLSFLDPPLFSVERGFYDEAFGLTLTSDMEGATIRYTTDGSAPTETNGQVLSIPPVINVSNNVAIRAAAFMEGYLPSEVVAHTYVLNAPESQKSAPSFFIVGDEEESLYEPDGIMAIVGGHYEDTYGWGCCEEWISDGPNDYNNPIQHGREYERPISLEYINPVDNSGFQLNCGVRVQGSTWHRPRYRRGDYWGDGGFTKFSFKFYFRAEYGQEWLEYPLFAQSAYDQFRIITLRGGMNDSSNPFIKDELIRRLHQDMGGAAVIGSIAHLYINGEYKTYYNPCERLDESTFQEWFDSNEEWDVFTQNAPWGADDARDGDLVAYNALLNYISSHDLSEGEAYEEVARRLDIKEFIDYLLVEMYSGNGDWPGNNWTLARERSDTGKFRFYVWDAEMSMESGRLDDSRLGSVRDEWGPISDFYRGLSDNADFRQLFGDRIQEHFFNEGALTEGKVEARFTELESEMSGIRRIDTFIRSGWIPSRRQVLLNAFTSEGLFTFEGPRFHVAGEPLYGGYVQAGQELILVNTRNTGTVYYTLDGTDPRVSESGELLIRDTLVGEDAPKSAIIPTANIGDAWRNEVVFDDSGWMQGTGGVGYEQGAGYEELIGIDVNQSMYTINTTCYIRVPFHLSEWGTPNFMTLKVRYDDGFVAYLNGVEVARSETAPDVLTYNAGSEGQHDDGAAVVWASFDVTDHIGVLHSGDNLLAIHGLNAGLGSSDFLISAELEAGERTAAALGVSPSAIAYTGPMSLTGSTHIRARVLDGGQWSAMSDVTFAVESIVDALRITEIMYHPEDAPGGNPDAEFIELQNTGENVINLNLVHFTNGVDFTFPDYELSPGAYAVIVPDQTAFESVYGTDIPVAGVYTGRLNNGGERIVLEDAAGTSILDFKYNDSWYPSTDGLGFSLNIVDADNPESLSWSLQESWRASNVVLGTPGSGDD